MFAMENSSSEFLDVELALFRRMTRITFENNIDRCVFIVSKIISKFKMQIKKQNKYKPNIKKENLILS